MIRAMIESDLAATVENDFKWPVTLTDQFDDEHIVYGQVNRIDQAMDPQTEQLVDLKRTSVALRISSLPFPLVDGKTPVKTTDISGVEVSGVVNNPKYDKSIGYVLFTIDTPAKSIGSDWR